MPVVVVGGDTGSDTITLHTPIVLHMLMIWALFTTPHVCINNTDSTTEIPSQPATKTVKPKTKGWTPNASQSYISKGRHTTTCMNDANCCVFSTGQIGSFTCTYDCNQGGCHLCNVLVSRNRVRDSSRHDIE